MTKIFIIDDDKSVVRLLVEFFEHHKFIAKGFFFEKEIITSIREFSPDIILCDMNLGSTSGLKILSELKQNVDLANILFVFLTGSMDETVLQQGLELGADDCLIKPIDLYQIKDHINHILNRTRSINSSYPITLLIDQNEKRMNSLMDFFISKEKFVIKASTLKGAKHILKSNAIDLIISSSNLEDGAALDFYNKNMEIFKNKYFAMIIDSKEYAIIEKAIKSGVNDFIYSNYGPKYYRGKLINIVTNFANSILVNIYSLQEKSPLHILESCEKDAFTGKITVISEKGKGFVNMIKGEYTKISFNTKKELTALELISTLTDGEMIVEQYPFKIN